MSDDKGKQKQKITMEIQDLNGHKLHVTLWDRFAQEMSDYVTNQTEKCQVIIILQFAKVSYYRDRPYVSNCYNVSRLFINSEIDEISTFRNTHVSLVSSMSYSLHDDFLVNNEFKNVADLIEVHEVKSFIIVGTIKLVRKDVPWYYLGCGKCTKKVKITYEIRDKLDGSIEEIPNYECNTKTCKGKLISVLPRFMIPLRVQDETGIVSLTLFDREANKILPKSANDLYEKNNELGDKDLFPIEFNELIEKNYAFKVDVTKWNLDNNSHVYGISILTNDEKIMTELQKKTNVQHIAESESLDLTCSDFPCDKHLKDAISCTGDNATPSNVEKCIASSPLANNKAVDIGISTPTELKRNLEDVYDEDDTTKMSATKTPRKAGAHDKQESMKGLLIPKKEK